jgi:hypothetical protein
MTPKKGKSVSSLKVNARTVNVTGMKGKLSGKNTLKPQRARQPNAKAVLEELESGKMTNQPPMNIAELRKMPCDLDQNEQGWFYKYIDPAGAVESHRAIGEFSKIPDGLCTFSVDAEIRIINTLSVPGQEDGEISLSGKTWSLALVSHPMFRTAYIAIANKYDKDISDEIQLELADTLNSLFNYRELITGADWIPFSTEGEGWYYKVQVLPPTFDAPDPVQGKTRTLTDWRMTFKSITVENNAPSLVDQGLIMGAHYALSDSPLSEPTTGVVEVPSVLLATRGSVPGGTGIQIRIPNLDQATVSTATPPPAGHVHFTAGAGGLLSSDDGSFAVGLNAGALSNVIQYRLEPDNIWYGSPGEVFATAGNIVTFQTSFTPDALVIANLTVPLTPPIIIPISPALGSTGRWEFLMDLSRISEQGGSAKVIDFPALRTDQVAANNVKMEQFQIHESEGGYLVHRKIRNPVFSLTPAQSYGPVIFNAPIPSNLKRAYGTGLLDTIDRNMSTGVVICKGIAWGNNPIVKVYQGWEGLTNVNTTFGQFGHAGLPKNDELLALTDNMSTMTTGFYPAKDNFAAALCKFGAMMLKRVLKSEATQGMMKNLAGMIIDRGTNGLLKRL